jgi:hypothetical protein
MTIQIVPAERSYVTEGFNLLVGSRTGYVSSVLRPMDDIDATKDWTPIHVEWADYNPYEALKALEIDASELQSESTYVCRNLKQTFQSVVPTYLLTRNVLAYKVFAEHYARTMFLDAEHMQDQLFPQLNDPGKKQSVFGHVMLGPGYSTGFRPSSGSRSLRDAHVVLSNGDLLMVGVWRCYHK